MTTEQASLYHKVVKILEQSRANVGRAVNTSIVTAYWFIGREIVLEIQKGEERAGYGKRVIVDLSCRLNKEFGKGFSTTNLRYFRNFYLAFLDRNPEIRHPLGGEFQITENKHISPENASKIFHPNLSWSHYRVLTQVANLEARDFYETEAVTCGWNRRELERQVHSLYYGSAQKLLK